MDQSLYLWDCQTVRERDIQDTVLDLLAIPGPEKPTKAP